ncbi:MAG: DUF2070 family protein [Candidatus Bilamarchaeaceae archaeon]
METEEKGSENLKKAVNLTNYFFELPPTHYLVGIMISIAIIFGLLTNYSEKENIIVAAIEDGFFLLLAPAFLTIVVVKALIRKVSWKRIIATTLAGEFIYAITYLIAMIVFEKNAFYGQVIILIGAAFVFLMWYLIARLVFILRYRSLLFSIMQLLFYMAFLFEFKATTYFSNDTIVATMIKAYAASFIFLGAAYLVFFVINAPMKKTFGYSSTDVFMLFVNQWLYKKNDLEEAFNKIGENTKTLIGVVGFKRKKDRIFFVVPYIHFGPFGNLGGSEFSHLIAEGIKKRYNSEAFVFHGTVTHDLNPTSSKELDKIMSTIEKVIERAKYSIKTTALAIGKIEECQADAIFFDNHAFVGVTRAPQLTEDINFGLGLAMMFAAEKKVEKAIVVDEHNAELGEVTSFEPGGIIGYNYIRAVEDALSKKIEKQKLKIGVAKYSLQISTIGKEGIKVAALSTKPLTIIVLIDSNGITPQFKERIEEELKNKYLCYPVVFTTDTHETNIVKGVFNPVKEENEVLNAIIKSAGEAINDMKEATAFIDKEWFEIRTIGAKHSIEIVSTINAIVAITKIIVPLILVGSIIAIMTVLSWI